MQPEGHGGRCAMGEQRPAPSGVYGYGTLEGDGPETWETLISPRETTGLAENRCPASDAQCVCAMHTLAAADAAQNEHARRGRPTARDDRSRG